MSRVEEILDFWFGGVDGFREAWFRRDDEFDREIHDRFREDYEKAAAGELDDWKSSPRGALALILLLDQFPRILFRDDPRSYTTDEKAREIADHAVSTGLDRGVQPLERTFVYLPFEHSEDVDDQRRSVELFWPWIESWRPPISWITRSATGRSSNVSDAFRIVTRFWAVTQHLKKKRS